jgi:hypothetical protein
VTAPAPDSAIAGGVGIDPGCAVEVQCYAGRVQAVDEDRDGEGVGGCGGRVAGGCAGRQVAGLVHDRHLADRLAAYLASSRRTAFNEDGIFRHYPELDLAVA